MKTIIIVKEDGSQNVIKDVMGYGSQNVIKDVMGYGLAAVTAKEIKELSEMECTGIDAMMLAAQIELVAEDIEEKAGFGRDMIEPMKNAMRQFDGRKED